jgi:hypothetical protein
MVKNPEYYNELDSFIKLDYDSFNVQFSKNVKISDSFDKEFFIKNIMHKNVADFSGILPPAIKYNIPGLIVFERPPTYQVLQYIPNPVSEINDDSEPATYRIPIPWQLYVISYDQRTYLTNYVRMFFMNSSLNSPHQNVFMPTLPNFFTNGLLCRPMYESMDDVNRYSKDLLGVISSAYDWIWNSGYNHDLTENLNYALKMKSFQQFLDKKFLENQHAYSSYHIRTSPYILQSILSAWEKIPFENILTVNWPNPSLTQSFEEDVEYYMENDYDRFGVEDSDDLPILYQEEQTFIQVIEAIFNSGVDCPESIFSNMDKIFSHSFKKISSD